MKSVLAIAFASFFALCFTLVNGGTVISRSPFSGCGDGEVLDATAIEYGAGTIKTATGTCPQAAKKAKRDVLERRQNICSDNACTISCQTESKGTIYVTDCQNTLSYLQAKTGNVTVPSVGYYEVNYASCTMYFVNLDSVNYTVCFSSFYSNAAATFNACNGKTNGAICSGSQAAGQQFAIVVGSNDTLPQT